MYLATVPKLCYLHDFKLLQTNVFLLYCTSCPKLISFVIHITRSNSIRCPCRLDTRHALRHLTCLSDRRLTGQQNDLPTAHSQPLCAFCRPNHKHDDTLSRRASQFGELKRACSKNSTTNIFCIKFGFPHATTS